MMSSLSKDVTSSGKFFMFVAITERNLKSGIKIMRDGLLGISVTDCHCE